jgi:predicted DsbA family dithiol-disulfide isomerase
MRIDIVADFVCPWCFIGQRRLARAMAMRPRLSVARTWRPFQLNPDLPLEGLSRELYLHLKFGGLRSAERIHNALATAGAREGIDFAFDRIRRTPNTLNAHRLIRLAAASGRADAVAEALFQGYFSDGVDIGDVDALARVAAGAGLAEEHRARRIGIDAVPCFIIDGDYALAGAQDPEMFLPLFDLALVPHLPLEA